MIQDSSNANPNSKNEISIRELITKIQLGLKYLIRNWKIIIAIGVFGGIIGACYAFLKKSQYVASCNFVLEDSKGGVMGQYAGLASLAGINLGGSSNEGIFEGDNIFALYQSRLMIEKTLLAKANFNGKDQLMIDRYIDFKDLRKSMQKDDKLKNLSFSGDPDHFNRQQDSIIKNIVIDINKNSLTVSKPDKKLNIIEVDTKFEDEAFAMEFNNKLVETVNDFYIKTKTKKTAHNVFILQKQVDSVKSVLNNSIGAVASALDAAPNANPSLLTLRVPSQKKQIDVQANTGIYSEMVKNLELGKITLRQETPLIQVIDKPAFPLDKVFLGKKKGFMIGFFIGAILTTVFFISKKLYHNILN
ncbi:lipopolysaccharide biosynthesis protein [Mucilaginibacter endophyticus]|uniref:lipopolysaccharide biosynthesis protein n=1 Tax=Mucilaginibacter endophyticus TaxID=2675003 RepID=UPI000E0DD540|nr:lipopolysaccharide biosynthesis protein [Mucilaginibacter endophyticus]